jgi:predicted ester cyclase
MPGFISDSPLARDLIRIGDEAIARQDDAALRDYFAEGYVFHGPGGDLGFDQLSDYFASLRAAFSDLRLVREQIITDGNFLAARTTFSGDFTAVFTYAPIGPVEPTGQHLEWEVIGTFRYHDDGRLSEEWVQTDYRSFLTKLGVTTTESAERRRLLPCSHRPSAGHRRTGAARTWVMPPDTTDLCRAPTGVPAPSQHRARIAAAFDAHSWC